VKIGVISDTHSIPIPKKVLEAFSQVDCIIHAGDICDTDTLKLLRKMKDVRAVQGNMDDSKIKKKLPLREYFDCEGIHIGVAHGHIGPSRDPSVNAKAQFNETEPLDILIYGHSHEAVNNTVDGILFFNPGSPNDLVKARFFSYGIIDIQKGAVKAEIIKI
jgi:putative phosphoesterase